MSDASERLRFCEQCAKVWRFPRSTELPFRLHACIASRVSLIKQGNVVHAVHVLCNQAYGQAPPFTPPEYKKLQQHDPATPHRQDLAAPSRITTPRIQQLTRKNTSEETQRPGTKVGSPRNSSPYACCSHKACPTTQRPRAVRPSLGLERKVEVGR